LFSLQTIAFLAPRFRRLAEPRHIIGASATESLRPVRPHPQTESVCCKSEPAMHAEKVPGAMAGMRPFASAGGQQDGERNKKRPPGRCADEQLPDS